MYQDYSALLIERRGAILYVTLNNPPLNPMTLRMHTELGTIFSDINRDADTRVVVSALLERLSPPMRAALFLRELEGLEYEEIAAVLGIPVGTVRSRLNSARAQFRTLWTTVMREYDDV